MNGKSLKSWLFCSAVGLVFLFLLCVFFLLGMYAGHQRSLTYVPLRSFSPELLQETEVLATININTADARELTLLNGIGEAFAQRIIDYREAHGDFASIEDIMLVPGIKQALFDNIREYISI